MIKKILIVAIVVMTICTFGFVNNHVVKLDGVLIENRAEEIAEVIYKSSKTNKIFNNMNGYIEVKSNRETFKYDFRNRHLSNNKDFNFIIVDRIYGNNDYEHGYAFFDDDIKNVVIITKERTVYAAEQAFIEKVREFYSD